MSYGNGFTPALNRFPLLDSRVAEFVTGLPATVWIHAGQGRAMFRRMAYDILPPRLAAVQRIRNGGRRSRRTRRSRRGSTTRARFRYNPARYVFCGVL
ncbi:MAG: hypothetical protein FJW39_35515 [Acidobacteria bacterium]|nr:hypothetical protein [Acidobacteriota bacterium]